MSQRSFASAEYAMKKKRTRREVFLDEMQRIVPWGRLEATIAPLNPRGGRIGRPPIGVAKMRRMYCLQQWYARADEVLMQSIVSALALVDVRVLDHLIVGGGDVVSFAERGLL